MELRDIVARRERTEAEAVDLADAYNLGRAHGSGRIAPEPPPKPRSFAGRLALGILAGYGLAALVVDVVLRIWGTR